MNYHETRKITGRGTNMKRTHLIAVLVGIIAVGIFATDVSGYYHAGMGRFLAVAWAVRSGSATSRTRPATTRASLARHRA